MAPVLEISGLVARLPHSSGPPWGLERDILSMCSSTAVVIVSSGTGSSPAGMARAAESLAFSAVAGATTSCALSDSRGTGFERNRADRCEETSARVRSTATPAASGIRSASRVLRRAATSIVAGASGRLIRRSLPP